MHLDLMDESLDNIFFCQEKFESRRQDLSLFLEKLFQLSTKNFPGVLFVCFGNSSDSLKRKYCCSQKNPLRLKLTLSFCSQ